MTDGIEWGEWGSPFDWTPYVEAFRGDGASRVVHEFTGNWYDGQRLDLT